MASSLDGPIVFRMAAGPRLGFGHLVRCRSLARAMGTGLVAAIRGSQPTREVARSLGWRVIDAGSDAAWRAIDPALIVIDDPSGAAAAAWVRRARRLGVPVASVHDLGLGLVDADVVIDGSITAVPAAWPGRPTLRGPSYAMVDPAILQVRQACRAPVPNRVLIALGGGRHVFAVAARLSAAIASRYPAAEIHVARGFAPHSHEPLGHGRWVVAPEGLVGELAEATVAVVAGGVTLYEACALGVPAVALAVTAMQRHTVRGMVARGAVLDGGCPPLDERTIAHAADATAILLGNERMRRRHAAVARRLVDGRGVFRVADRLRRLVVEASASVSPAGDEGVRDVA